MGKFTGSSRRTQKKTSPLTQRCSGSPPTCAHVNGFSFFYFNSTEYAQPERAGADE